MVSKPFPSWLLATAAALLCCQVTVTTSYEAPDDCEWKESGDNAFALTCHLSAINSNLEKTNFSVIPSEGTRSLTVRCAESSLSALEPSAFANLLQLEELVIEECRIERIPKNAFGGLDRLQRLSVNTAHSSILVVDEGALSNLPLLQQLDLSGNYLRSLPRRELCNLPELRQLNLSSNEIGNLNEVLSADGKDECLSKLEVLDLSNNEITTLDSDSVVLRSLKELKLNSNFIRHVGRLPSAPQMKEIDLSQNQISSLAMDLFRSSSNTSSVLLALNLANNSLSSLEESTFDGLTALELLDLSGNHLTSAQVNRRLTRDLSGLLELNLSGNRLAQQLDPTTLASSPKLEALKLDNNQLETLPSFSPLKHLKSLDLSGNLFSVVDASSFEGLEKLTHLHLSRNKISSIADNSLQNCTSILVLDLSHNQLIKAPETIGHLRSLQTLDLSYNLIDSLDSSPVLRMSSLWRLQLSHNKLKNITLNLLNQLQTLQILDVSGNSISDVERGSFDANKQLKAIRLDNNQLRTMDGLFQNLSHLTWLNISSNEIVQFDYALVPRGLHWLDLSHNKLQELGNYFDLTSEVSMGVLDVSFNAIRQLGPNSIPDSIETLLVNDNRLEQIVPYTFFKKSKLSKVDLTVNSLKSIDRNALRLSSEVSRLPDFYLGGNPIECDCEMVWFKTINSAAASDSMQNYPLIQDIESIYCRLVHTREVSFVPLVEARNEQFLCPYDTHCFALCKCCDFDACDCEMSCPDNCTCYHDNSWSKNIAVCSAEGFKDLPDQLPMDATEIFLDGNVLSELGSHTFIGRKNLRVLHLNHSQIHSIQNKTFNGLRSLTVLHLEGNQLTRLDGFEFETLSGLRELYLQNNLLSSIHNMTFQLLRGLEVLHLHGNRLIDFPVWQLAFNPFLVSVKLAENLWSCECEYMERFRSWMSVYSSKIFDAESVSCVSNDASADGNVRMREFDVSTCTGSGNGNMQAIATTRVQERSTEDYLPLLAATLASFAVVLLLLLAVFVYRHTLRVWIHSKYGVRVFDSSFNADDDLIESGGTLDSNNSSGIQPKLFDIFVSYSPKDDLFVRDVLAGELEHGSSQYKTCLYHRDIASQTYVADTILQATEASRRSLVVLSDNFLKSEWSRYDYKSGMHQAMRTGRRKLIVIMLGDICSRELDPDLRLYLKTSVVLQWGDRLFWEKLRYALPDVPMTKIVNEKIKSSPGHIGVHTISNSMAEEHYYQQPRYATYMPPPPPPPLQQQPVMSNSPVQFLNNNHRMLPSPPRQQQQVHNQYGHHQAMPSVPGQQVPSGRTVIMHI